MQSKFRKHAFLGAVFAVTVFTFSTAQLTLGQTPVPNSADGVPQQPAQSKAKEKASVPGTNEPDDDVVRVETDLVTTLFTAVDKERRFITTLRQEDLRIKENGVEQEITLFERETDRPLSIVVLVDTSKSQENTLPDEKRAAKKFIDAVVRPDKDQVAVVSFDGRPHLEAPPSNDVVSIKAAIDKIEVKLPPEGCSADVSVLEDSRCYTSIWDSVIATANQLLSRTNKRTRRVIILLTDGDDSSSQADRADAIKAAISNDVAVYGIGVGDPELYKIERGALSKLTERTGGRAFFPKQDRELSDAFAQIQEEMRSQYVVAYTPKKRDRDGSYRKIKLEVITPELRQRKLQLLHRQGYYARPN